MTLRAWVRNSLHRSRRTAGLASAILPAALAVGAPGSSDTRAETAGNRLEIALVLDVTGSMKDDIEALRQAAKTFADIVSDNGQNASVYISIVPYVATVNVGVHFPEAFLDTNAEGKYHARHLERRWFADAECGDDGTVTHDELLPPGHLILKDDDGCAHLATPARLNNFDLFNRVKGASWKGCVEARPEPHDTTGAPPDMSDPDTLWVPYFWPDEPDPFQRWVHPFHNNYLTDGPFIDGSQYGRIWQDGSHEGSVWRRFASILKYDGARTADIDETPPDTSGPNRACPDPILPLTNDHAGIHRKLDALTYWSGGGTMANIGAVWGWRTLTPQAPFTQGAPKDDARKIRLLMSDGENQILSNDVKGPTKSDYSAYGYLRWGRFRDDRFSHARDSLNSKLVATCTNAKQDGVMIYAITLGLKKPETQALYDGCASSGKHVRHIANGDALDTAFGDIARAVIGSHAAE